VKESGQRAGLEHKRDSSASRRSFRHAIDDAYLGALAISRGATLASFDRDFEPFVRHGLRWERPGT
jgi:predicted nucleic acid-binding protein